MSDRQWWNCTVHSFGWRGDPVPCPLCGTLDNVQPGAAIEDSKLPKRCDRCDVLWVGPDECWNCGRDDMLSQPTVAAKPKKPTRSWRRVA